MQSRERLPSLCALSFLSSHLCPLLKFFLAQIAVQKPSDVIAAFNFSARTKVPIVIKNSGVCCFRLQFYTTHSYFLFSTTSVVVALRQTRSCFGSVSTLFLAHLAS